MRNFILLVCLLGLTSCYATTHVTGVTDPRYRGSYHVEKVAVVTRGMSLKEQQSLEASLQKALSAHNITVLKGQDLFPPTQTFSRTEKLRLAAKKGADSVLLIEEQNRRTTQTEVPEIYLPGTSTSYVSGFSNFATINTHTTPGQVVGGGSVMENEIAARATLISAKTRQVVWVGDGGSDSASSASFAAIYSSFADAIVDELVADGLIKP